MRTLQDIIDAGEDAPYRSRIEVGGTTRKVVRFRCRCGRLVVPRMMLEVRPPDCDGVPDHLCGHDRFRCDGCWRGWVRRGDICPDELRALTRQPARASAAKPW